MTVVKTSTIQIMRIGKYMSQEVRWKYLRPEVQAFATVMEHQLRRNDSKGGWKHVSLHYLSRRLTSELAELRAAFKRQNKKHVVAEAADTANFIMMIADHSGELDWMQDHSLKGGYNDECRKH